MPTVTGTEVAPNGSAAAKIPVRIRLVASTAGEAAGYDLAGNVAISGLSALTTDGAGVWSAVLTANSLITPAGTVYVATVHHRDRPAVTHTFSVPDGTGPYRVEDILAPLPGALATAGSAAALAAHAASASAHGGVYVAANDLFLNVTSAPYGAVGDGVADDTAAIQAALATLTLAAPATVYLPPGIYRITSALTVPHSPGSVLLGAGRLLTTIRQATNAIPIIKYLGLTCHSMQIRSLSLEYATQQTVAAATAVQYVGVGAGSSFYHHVYDDVRTYRAGIDFGIDTSVPATAMSVWDCHWNDVHMYDTGVTALDLVPTLGVGQPINTLSSCEVNNTGGSVVPTGPMFRLSGVEIAMDGMNLEGWHNRLVEHTGGGFIAMDHVHVESQVMTAGFSKLIELADTVRGSFDHWDVTFGSITAGVTDQMTVLSLAGSPSVSCAHWSVNILSNLSTTTYIRGFVYTASTTSRVVLSDITDTSGFFVLPAATGQGASQVIEEFPTAGVPGWRLGGDVTLYRSAANQLRTDDALDVVGALTQNGVGVVVGPELDAKADLDDGRVPTAQLGTGEANTSTVLRGDRTWAALAGAPTGVEVVAPAPSGGDDAAALAAAYAEAAGGILRLRPGQYKVGSTVIWDTLGASVLGCGQNETTIEPFGAFAGPLARIDAEKHHIADLGFLGNFTADTGLSLYRSALSTFDRVQAEGFLLRGVYADQEALAPTGNNNIITFNSCNFSGNDGHGFEVAAAGFSDCNGFMFNNCIGQGNGNISGRAALQSHGLFLRGHNHKVIGGLMEANKAHGIKVGDIADGPASVNSIIFGVWLEGNNGNWNKQGGVLFSERAVRNYFFGAEDLQGREDRSVTSENVAVYWGSGNQWYLRDNRLGAPAGAITTSITNAIVTTPANDTVESWEVASTVGFTYGMYLKIDSEVLHCEGAIDADTLSVRRGIYGSTVATHSAATALQEVSPTDLALAAPNGQNQTRLMSGGGRKPFTIAASSFAVGANADPPCNLGIGNDNPLTAFGNGKDVMGLRNARTVPPSNPTGGGIIYAEAGALKWKGPNGTVTTLAPA